MRRLIFISLIALLAASCVKKHECADYASAEKEVVWDDYNTVQRVNDNFRCYRASREEHLGDTLAVAGYRIDTNMYYSGGEGLDHSFGLVIGDRPCAGWLRIDEVPGEMFSVIRQGVQKLYIIGTLGEEEIYDGGCCGYRWPAVKAFSLDTVPHYELLKR